MTLKTELKLLAAILIIIATMLGSAYATYRVDRHVITTLKRDNRELRAVAGDYQDIMTVASHMAKVVIK